ncbi:MAG TPA: Asp23/Gls24 family envelope stress response protein [bacterium]|nr:Asp23/Gls24 family envelope stress response protein [bacterium]HPO09264.1 Asp23/Gls24 family envelope stress response protein [bacterium]HQO33255.1 Asp23/Gls24 family envelope stress response protein [bacterium]HQP97952.1 Asp23/Gls24 family envelope stress response protein [bacterium]
MNEITTTNLSDPSVADDVFATVAALCACRVPGVAAVGGLDVNRAEAFLRNGDVVRGVKVAVSAGDVAVDLNVSLWDEIPIPQVAATLQSEVKHWIEEMIGHSVSAVNVTVEDIRTQEMQDIEIDSPVALSQAVGV